MPGHRYAMQRDKSEKTIVSTLLAVGAKVIRLTEFDLLVLYRGNVTMLECKSTRGKKQTMRSKTSSQEALITDGWPLFFVTNPSEALKAIGLLP